MRIICDTHIPLFWANAPSRLSVSAAAALEKGRQDGQLAIANISLWELATVWQLTRSFLLLRHSRVSAHPDPLDVHRRLIAGLAGESLLVSSSMFLDTLSEAEGFFELSFKTIKSRLGRALDTAASERAMRGARATLTAAEVFGDFEAARTYMHTPNYALGGHTPAELIKTSEGERIVLNELQTQAEGGPL